MLGKPGFQGGAIEQVELRTTGDEELVIAGALPAMPRWPGMIYGGMAQISSIEQPIKRDAATRRYTEPEHSIREIAKNFLRKDFVDLSVPGNWLGPASSRLMKNVMAPTMAQQYTAWLLQLADQISSLQATTSSAVLRMPGRSSLANSR